MDISILLFFILMSALSIDGILSENKKDSYVAACLIIKDEGEYLQEWIEYHRRLGISKFYIFDHNSTNPIYPIIADHIKSGLVDFSIRDFSFQRKPPQMTAYSECLKLHGNRHQFMAFIDSDEFIVIVNKSQSLPDILHNYEDVGGISLNWMMFGSSGHVTKPPGGVLENYHRCHKTILTKTIVNTDHLLSTEVQNPHYFPYKEGYYAVTVDRKPIVDKLYSKHVETAFDTMYINHYNTKSLEEFQTKRKRGRGAMRNPDVYKDDYFDIMRKDNNMDCPILKMPEI